MKLTPGTDNEYSVYFFFFKQKTAYEIKECDWSSDVCSSDLPNGEYFSQGEYFVKFILHFDVGNASYTLASRGHFSNDEWGALTNSGPDGRQFNQTYLESLDYDGLIDRKSVV